MDRTLPSRSDDAAPRCPFVPPHVTDHGALRDVTRMFSATDPLTKHVGKPPKSPFKPKKPKHP
jgi:hypothetical protein